MGAITQCVQKAVDAVADQALDVYEARIDSRFTNATVKQVRDHITDEWWGVLGGKDPTSTKATHVCPPVVKNRGSRILTADADSWSDEALFDPKSEGITAYRARNIGKTAKQSKDGALIPIATSPSPAHLIFYQIFFMGELGAQGPYNNWYHRYWPVVDANSHKGPPLESWLVSPAHWTELQNILDSIVS